MARWGDLANIWNTLRELDVAAVRAEAEHPLSIALLGDAAALQALDQLLQSGAERYPPVGENPLQRFALPLSANDETALRGMDLLLLGFDGASAGSASAAALYERLERLQRPLLVVVVGSPIGPLPPRAQSRMLHLPLPQAPEAMTRLGTALLRELADELELSAARRLPGLRQSVSNALINSVSFTNGSYAATTGLAEQVPVLNIPFATADIFVLTKNQALLVYRLALANGAPPDFAARMREVLPVLGGAYLWRQLARTLIGLVPVWGLLPKVAIAYAGTYATGVSAWAWYARGHRLNPDELQRVSRQALTLGRQRASELVDQMRHGADNLRRDGGNWLQRAWLSIRRRLPGAKPELLDRPSSEASGEPHSL